MKSDQRDEEMDLLLRNHLKTEIPPTVQAQMDEQIEALRRRLAARETSPSQPRLFPVWHRWVACAGAAAVLILVAMGYFLLRPMTRPPEKPTSYFKCVLTTYVEGSQTEWLKKRVVIRTFNGKQGYFDVTLENKSGV